METNVSMVTFPIHSVGSLLMPMRINDRALKLIIIMKRAESGDTQPDIYEEIGCRNLHAQRKKILNYRERKSISSFFYRIVFLPE